MSDTIKKQEDMDYFTVSDPAFDLSTYWGRALSIASSMDLDKAWYTGAGVKEQ